MFSLTTPGCNPLAPPSRGRKGTLDETVVPNTGVEDDWKCNPNTQCMVQSVQSTNWRFTPPKWNSSPLKITRLPIGKDRLPSLPFFRGKKLNFGGVSCWVVVLEASRFGRNYLPSPGLRLVKESTRDFPTNTYMSHQNAPFKEICHTSVKEMNFSKTLAQIFFERNKNSNHAFT